MSALTTLKIKDIIKETASSVSLVFDKPQGDGFNFVPGQFITLISNIEGNEIRRAYSISSSPNNDIIKVCIKRVSGGVFSNYANDSLQKGEAIKVLPPEGKFQLHTNPSNSKKYAAFAAGSGVTPIMSMIKATMENEPQSKFVLVYGNKSIGETIYYNEIQELKSKYENRFFVEYVFSQESNDNAQFGRIDKSIINLITQSKYESFSFDDYYLCGHEAMINTAKEELINNNVSEDVIHIELFTTSSSNAMVENTLEGTYSLKIVVDDEEIAVEADKQISLLDNALKHDIDAPYSCKGGVCCSCICRVTEGEAKMQENNMLTDDEIKDGLVLACQAYAVSNTIKIDFDDA